MQLLLIIFLNFNVFFLLLTFVFNYKMYTDDMQSKTKTDVKTK